MNFNQVFSYFHLQPIAETTFCISYQHKNKVFSIFRSSSNGNVQCLYLNKVSVQSPEEIFFIISDSLLFNDKEIIFNDLPEFGTDLELIPQDKLINYLYGFVPLREVVWDSNAVNILRNDCFENIYCNSKNSNLSMVLSQENTNICDVLDFDRTNYATRFDNDSGYWTSKYYSNMKEAVLCFNPYCLVNFYEDNVPSDYYTMVITSNQNLLLQIKVFELLLAHPFTCYNILYTQNAKELYSILDLLVFYTKYYWMVDVTVRYNVDSFTLCFTFDLETNLIEYIQFTSNVNSHYHKLLNASAVDMSKIKNNYSLKITNTIIEDRKIYALTCPNKIECYEAVIHNLLLLINRTKLFNIIRCK